jgi:hypothetical protein
MNPVHETLTTRSMSDGRSSARSSAQRAMPVPAARAISLLRWGRRWLAA